MPTHGQITFGPGLYIFSGFFILIGLLGIWMMIDTTRAKRRLNKSMNHIPHEPLSVYALCGGLYAAAFLAAILLYAINAKQTLFMIFPLAGPILVLVELAYLLRVVFPKSAPAASSAKEPKRPQHPDAIKPKPDEAEDEEETFLPSYSEEKTPAPATSKSKSKPTKEKS